MVKGVITGDIVASSSKTVTQRERLLDLLNGLKTNVSCEISIEIFRGDSFQIVVDEAKKSLFVAVVLRALLRSNTPKNSSPVWDARLSIGIGDVDLITDKIATSDGEAFKNSGRGFDSMKKNERTVIRTPWDDFNNELEVSMAFADEVLTNWTRKQATVAYWDLTHNLSQKELAVELEMTIQNISALLANAKMQLIRRYIDRFESKVSQYGAK